MREAGIFKQLSGVGKLITMCGLRFDFLARSKYINLKEVHSHFLKLLKIIGGPR